MNLENISFDPAENPGIDPFEDSCFSAQNRHRRWLSATARGAGRASGKIELAPVPSWRECIAKQGRDGGVKSDETSLLV